MSFKKNRDNVSHPQVQCYTSACEFKKECKQSYKYCHDKTGFTTPCNSCDKITYNCKIYLIACKTQKPIMNCKFWVHENRE